jgi:hypothetical protein
MDHIRWLIRNRPRSSLCRTPVVSVDPKLRPDIYAELKSEWLKQLASPDDLLVVRGAAAFLTASDVDAAKALLEKSLRTCAEHADAWIDLDRMNADPAERLRCFEMSHLESMRKVTMLIQVQ